MNIDEQRFGFGANWQDFSGQIDEARIERAIDSLRELLGVRGLSGCRFLDIGSGSGLFSLAASRLGAQVVALDYDPDSVRCTRAVLSQDSASSDGSTAGAPPTWHVHQGSVLDADWMASLGTFDIVYSWGVLHHTGNLSLAMRLAAERVADGGRLAIAIYNDQGGASRRWLAIKQIYNRLPRWLRPLWVCLIAGCYEMKFALARLAGRRNPLPFADWSAKRQDRGMSVWHDWVDWIGGLPFEVAKPEAIIHPLLEQGFELQKLTTVGCGWGCNEFVFVKK